MTIYVEYTAQLKRAAGTGAETVELAAPATLDTLLAALASRHGEELQRLLFDGQGRRRPSVLIFVGERQAPRNESVELAEHQVVTLVSPISGG
jgi:molybdopterin converting factor small subunit